MKEAVDGSAEDNSNDLLDQRYWMLTRPATITSGIFSHYVLYGMERSCLNFPIGSIGNIGNIGNIVSIVKICNILNTENFETLVFLRSQNILRSTIFRDPGILSKLKEL